MGHAGILALDAPLAQQCLPLCSGKNLPGPMDPAGAQAQGVGRKHQIAHGQAAVLQPGGAAANAENNHKMDPEKLYVSEVFATPGPIIKRIMPRAQGRAYRINKRTSHVTLAVAEKE